MGSPAGNWFDQNAPSTTAAAPATGSGGDWFSQNAPGATAGSSDTDIAHQPASVSGVLQTLGTKEGLQAAADPLVGFVKGLGDTVHGTGELIRKGGNAIHAGLGDKIVPPEGQNALDTMSTSSNGAQLTGKALEMVAEGLTGEGAVDETGKALSLGDKMKKLGAIASFMEKHPIIAKMIVGAGKGAAVGGAQGTVKTGDVKTGAEAAAGGAVLGGVGSGVSQGVSKGVKYVRELYKPLVDVNAGTIDPATGLIDPNTGLKDIKSVQPIIQKGIRDTLTGVAKQAGVKPAISSSIRDVVADTAEAVKAKAQPVFQAVDDFSNGEFSNAQAAARKYSGALDKAGKDAFDAALQKQDALFQKYASSPKAAHSPEALAEAKATWKQYRDLQEVDDAVKASTSGQRPEIAASSQSKQPAEQTNPKMLFSRLNRLYNTGTLESALGKDGAHTLLQHAGDAQQTVDDILYQNRQTLAANKAKNAETLERNKAQNQAAIERNKAENERKLAGRRTVGTIGATAATAGAATAAGTAIYKGVKNALGGGQ